MRGLLAPVGVLLGFVAVIVATVLEVADVAAAIVIAAGFLLIGIAGAAWLGRAHLGGKPTWLMS